MSISYDLVNHIMNGNIHGDMNTAAIDSFFIAFYSCNISGVMKG